MSDPVGYCGVVLPAQNEYQGFFIYDVPEIAVVADDMIAQAQRVQGDLERAVLAALEATLVEGCLNKRDELIAPAALAIRRLWGHDFFYVQATVRPDGTITDLIELHATTCDEARDEINTLPAVKALKRRLFEDLMASKKRPN